MSIVLGTITKDFAVMTGDKRGTNLDGSFFDNAIKVFNVNNMLIGFTGDYSIPKVLMDKDNIALIENHKFVDSLHIELSEMLLEYKGSDSNLLILGKNSSKEYEMNFMHPGSDYKFRNTVVDLPISVALTPPGVNQKECQEILVNRIGFNPSIEHVERVHKKIVREVSKLDKTVSSRCDRLMIYFD